MDKLKTRLDGLEDKIRKLIERVEKLKTENTSLKEQVSEFQFITETQKKQIKDVGERNKMVKLAETVSNEGFDRADMKKRIDKHLKEIDKCIALLNE